MAHSSNLRAVVFETLQGILSHDGDVRRTAEDQKSILEVTEEYGLILAEFTCNPSNPASIRQLASVLLRHYIDNHWSSVSEKFFPMETLPEVKCSIRNLLPRALADSDSRVRSSVSLAVASIARWDWPANWPQLVSILLAGLKEPSSAVGYSQLLKDFLNVLSGASISQLSPQMLPELLQLTVSPQFDARVRSRAVDAFCICLQSAIDNEAQPTITQLDGFCAAFVQGFLQRYDEFLLKRMVKASILLIQHFPAVCGPHMDSLLAQIWSCLTEGAERYTQMVINNNNLDDEEVDSDGESCGTAGLVAELFELVAVLVEEGARWTSVVESALPELLYMIILYAQVSEMQVHAWGDSIDKFLEEEDEEAFVFTVRSSALELVQTLEGSMDEVKLVNALWAAVSRHLMEANDMRHNHNPHWWKRYESCLRVVSTFRDRLLDDETSLKRFLEQVVLPDLQSLNVSPFLLSQLLITASCYCDILPDELATRLLHVTQDALQVHQPMCLRVSSTRALRQIGSHLAHSGRGALMAPFLPALLEALVSLTACSSLDVVAIVIECLLVLFKVDTSFVVRHEPRIVPLGIALFLKSSHDPLIASLVDDYFAYLCGVEGLHLALVQRLLPTLVSILNAPKEKVPSHLVPAAIDLLTHLVAHGGASLPDAFLQQGFPALFQHLAATDDAATLQNGCECLSAFISTAPEQVAAWRGDHAVSAPYLVTELIGRLLDPQTAEHCATCVGLLISTVLSHWRHHVDAEPLLRAVLSKLQSTHMFSVAQGLVMVLVRLMLLDTESLLHFLSSVPGPHGESALRFVLEQWVSKHPHLNRSASKLSCHGLARLLEFVLIRNDIQFEELFQRGEKQEMPVLAVALKVLIQAANDDNVDTSSEADDDSDEFRYADKEHLPPLDLQCFVRQVMSLPSSSVARLQPFMDHRF